MSRPIVAIVGRPNVGKSTLVNRIAQTSDAIVHQSRGVTRDRSYHVADWNGREFMLVNKLDNPARENDNLWEFYSLGVGDPVAVSALHGHGTGDLLDEVVALLPEDTGDEDTEPDTLRVAIIGRPNAGKSSLFNKMIGNDRSIVSRTRRSLILPSNAGAPSCCF